jgi:hypothetical protein
MCSEGDIKLKFYFIDTFSYEMMFFFSKIQKATNNFKIIDLALLKLLVGDLVN